MTRFVTLACARCASAVLVNRQDHVPSSVARIETQACAFCANQAIGVEIWFDANGARVGPCHVLRTRRRRPARSASAATKRLSSRT
ncbi:MAG TPA: hypothetical protein VND97_00605 [Beijerinckiaceae bacterium]|nr:hypothetical protein [Beijerinckiaceae bacterium]